MQSCKPRLQVNACVRGLCRAIIIKQILEEHNQDVQFSYLCPTSKLHNVIEKKKKWFKGFDDCVHTSLGWQY